MSKFYGTVQGARGEATRCGHTDIKASAQSYDGSVIIRLRYGGYDEDREHLMVSVGTARGSSEYGNTIWDGPIDEFERILREAH